MTLGFFMQKRKIIKLKKILSRGHCPSVLISSVFDQRKFQSPEKQNNYDTRNDRCRNGGLSQERQV